MARRAPDPPRARRGTQAARDDGTLPRRLSLEQLWVQAEGGVQLVDLLEESGDESSPEDPSLGRRSAAGGGSGRLDRLEFHRRSRGTQGHRVPPGGGAARP